MKTAEKLVPQLRFSEFNDDLICKTIGEVCEVKTGGKDTKDKDDDGLYPFFVRSNNVEKINCFSYDGEAILTSGDGVGVGKNFHYINGKFDYHQRVYALKEFNKNYNGKFIYHFFSEKFYRRVLGLSAKNSVDSVRMDFITKMKINFPTLPEQQKIASFLTDVDVKITQLTKKKTLLEQYKKGVMQKIFNQELRFKPNVIARRHDEAISQNKTSFPDWEEKKLGEVFKISAGGDIDKINVSKEKSRDFKFPIFANSEKQNGLYGYSNIYKIDFECVTVTGRGSLGNAVARYDKFYPIVRLLVLKPKINLNVFFFENAINQLNILSESTGVPQLTAPQIATYKIGYPSLKEQTKIANFLSDIDTKIEAVNTKIENSKTFKKGLLQQMFV